MQIYQCSIPISRAIPAITIGGGGDDGIKLVLLTLLMEAGIEQN